MSQPVPVRIDFVSDVVCPWCAIGLASLERALETLKDELRAEIHVHPFELNPQMKPGGEDIGEHLARKYGLDAAQLAQNQEAIRQHAIAVLNLTQQAKQKLAETDAKGESGNTSLIDGVRKFVNVRDLDIDLIDRINPFDAAYAVLAKAMDEKVLRQVQASIAAKRVAISLDEARDLAKRALIFKNERGRAPEITSPDAWERRMAEGVAALARHLAQQKAAAAKGGSHV